MLLAAATIAAALQAVGDVAPPLAVTSWIQHPQHALPERGHVTVVEFWATWCGPCIANIPHLTALQKTYAARGVVVVGATSVDEWGNDRAAVERLIAAKRASFDYAVALLPDTRGIHLNPWFRAAHIDWLPTAFVIARDGRIAFIGDPMQVDDVIPAVLDGSWDFTKARRRYIAVGRARELLTSLEASDRAQTLHTARMVLASDAREDPRTMMVLGSKLAGKFPKDGDVLRIATEAAQRAVDLTKSESPGMLDLLAGIWFARGDSAKAVKYESLAVQKSEGPMRDAQMKNLEKYRAAR